MTRMDGADAPMAKYYDILGVRKDADEKTIKRAYRKLARQYHPDLNPGDKKSERRFKDINEAYEVLSDEATRRKYDRYGDRWKQAEQFESRFSAGRQSPFERAFGRRGGGDGFGFDPFGGLEDLLGDLGTSSRRRGASTATRLESSVDVSLEEAFAGTKRLVTISGPEGQRRIEVSIPAGVDTGSVVHIDIGKGQDLFINVSVQSHTRFQRSGVDLHTELELPLFDALLGGEAEVSTLGGKVRLKVPPESQNGQRIRLTGRGMPELGKPETKGDLFVIVRPRLPSDLTDDERDLIRRLKELRD